MDNGIYVALSRQMGLFRDMDMTANNIANADTVGFGAEKIMFDDFLVKTSPDGGPRTAFTNDFGSYRDISEGPLKVTSNPLDVAISGPGYFAVQTPLGERYTRAGNFQLDTDGMLVTPEGYQVLDNGGQPIQFEAQDREIAIGEAGDIIVDGQPRTTLGVYEFSNPQLMERSGSTLYKAEGAQPATASRVMHGTLEGSNISPVMELTHMIQVQRSVGSTAKLIDAQYELTRKTSDTWAKSQ